MRHRAADRAVSRGSRSRLRLGGIGTAAAGLSIVAGCAVLSATAGGPSRVVISVSTFWDGAGAPRSATQIVIENGHVAAIQAVGSPIHEGTHSFDFHGLTVIPSGFALHAARSETPNSRGITADARLMDREDPSASDFADAARLGATAFLLEAFPQSTIGGVSSVYRPLDYWSNRRQVVEDVGLTLSARARTVAPKRTSMEATWEVRKLLLEARERNSARASLPATTDSGAIDRLLSRTLRAQVYAPTLADVARAVAIGQEFDLSMLLTGVRRVPVAPLPADRLGVLLAPAAVDDLPETWDAYARLRGQHVPVGIVTTGAPLPTLLATSRSAAGRQSLSETEMLQAFTSAPARLLGAARLGTLTVGQSADFLVLSGRLFDPETRIERVFIEGREVFNRSGPSR